MRTAELLGTLEQAQEYRELARRLGLRRPPPMLTHREVSTPQAIGVFRPAILLPLTFFRDHSRQEIDMVLAHELAHVRRCDLLWLWVRRCVNALLFFHPLLWKAHEEATLAAEIACDETAIQPECGVSAYAKVLLKVAQQSEGIRSEVLSAAGMTRAFRVVARRMEALRRIASPSSAGAVRGRRLATGVAIAAGLLLGPLGLVTLLDNSGIDQIDPRYRVLGYKFSRGVNHHFTVQQEECRVGALRFASATTLASTPVYHSWTGSNGSAAAGLPTRLAGWFNRAGVKARVSQSGYSCGISTGNPSYAFLVRCAKPPENGEEMMAELVDGEGESIPLLLHSSERVAPSGEFVAVWTLSPAPVTGGTFKLALKLANEKTPLAILRLGKL